MRKEAEAHAAEDKKKVELIEARNEADAIIFQVEKLLKEHGDKLGESDKAADPVGHRARQAGRQQRGRAGDQAGDQRPQGGRQRHGAAHQRGGGPTPSSPPGDGRAARRRRRQGRRDRRGVRGQEVSVSSGFTPRSLALVWGERRGASA